MTFVQYLTAVTIGAGGGIVVFWIYALGLRVLAHREAKAADRRHVARAAAEANRMEPIRQMMTDLGAAHAAFWREHGWRPTRMLIPSAKAKTLFEPWSSPSDVTFKQQLESCLGVNIEFSPTIGSVQFDRWVEERAQWTTQVPDFAKAAEIQKLEAEKDREQKKLELATARGAWADGKASCVRLVELEAQIAAVRERPAATNMGGTFRVQG